MTRNYKTIATLIRGRVIRPYEQALDFFHEKGVSYTVEDENLYSVKTETDGHQSELTEVCHNGLIYRDIEVVCYRGPRVKKMTLAEAKEDETISWKKESTVFAEYVDGKRIYMYWDPGKEDWGFADENKAQNNSYGKLLRDKLYNINNIEYFYTYVFIVSESGDRHKNGIYLERMIDNKAGTEVFWDHVWRYATRLKTLPVQYYYFEGFDKLEEQDFPIYVLDKNKNRVLLESME